MPKSQTFLYLQQNKEHFLKVPSCHSLFLFNDPKSHRIRINRSC